MEFLILGTLEVLIGNHVLDIGGQRQQTVLATLALENNRVIRVARLVEALYGEDHPPTARVQVQICISALRRLFSAHGHPDTIVTRSQGYCLQVPDDSLDLYRYESELNQARQLREFKQSEEAVSHYRSALALWRGPALDGIESAVVRSAAGRLTDRRITATEECIELELALGRHREQVDELTELVAEHPLRERLRGQLMLALYRSGRQAEALESFRIARRRFVDELGLEPNEELRDLEHAILTSDPRLALPEQVVAASPVVPPAGTAPAGLNDEDIRTRADAVAELIPVPAVPVSRPSAQPAVPGMPWVPGLLPTDIADFTGRVKQIDAIEEQFALAADDSSRYAVPVVVMAGKPGIGKTTLAVHVSHRLAARYPDGQLFADLHGRHSDQVGPMQVLERFLRALGVPGTGMPEGLEERAELYRGLLSDRRMLVVLDNAGGEGQVRPLVPGTSQSAVLVTSRSRLAGLPGAVHVDVDVFDPRHSVELLARIAGAERVEAEPDSTAELAELCGHLPLALRIAGARLAARPHWSVDQLVERLANEARRLDELKHSGMGIRASISLTYDHLEAPARRLFRLLTVLDAPHFSGWVAAALLAGSFPDAQDLLDDLADAQLIETTTSVRGAHAQYRLHDLIRVFARERLIAEESVTEREAALERVLGALLFLSGEAHRGVYGGDYLRVRGSASLHPLPARQVRQLVDPPLSWFERERLTIVAAVRQAAQAGLVEHCWNLAMTAVTLFESRIYLSDWRETHQIAFEAARQAGDERGQAAMLYSTGSLYIVEQRFEDALRDLAAAAELFQQAGDEQGIALVARHVGFVDRMNGRYEEATGHYTEALAMFRRNGDLVAAAYVLHSLAQIKLEQGDLDAARKLLPEALEQSRRAGSRRVEAQVLHRLGEVHLQAGRPHAAIEVLEQALGVVRDLGDPVGEAYALHGLGIAHLNAGDLIESGTALQGAMRLACETGERLVEARVSMGLGELAMACDNPPQAVVHLHRSLGLFRAIRAPLLETKVLALLSDAYAAAGNPEDAVTMPAPPAAPTRKRAVGGTTAV